jgi:SAM-dependent methyltransferase
MMATVSELVKLQQTLYTSRNPTRRWLHCTRRDWIVDAILRRSSSGRRNAALEVGPGSGLYLPTLATLYDQVTASDIQIDYLEHSRSLSREYPNLEFVVDDITDTALPPASFDLILCSEVVEHISDSAAALRSMHHLLRPGGTLILSTPQRDCPLEIAGKVAFLPGIIQLVRMVYREPILKTGHINLMTSRQVRRQLRAAGFRTVERFKSGVYLPVITEFGGRLGQRLQERMETWLRGGPLDRFLWTQYYVVEW